MKNGWVYTRHYKCSHQVASKPFNFPIRSTLKNIFRNVLCTFSKQMLDEGLKNINGLVTFVRQLVLGKPSNSILRLPPISRSICWHRGQRRVFAIDWSGSSHI